MTSSANGIVLVDACVTMPRIGAWHADIELDRETTLADAVSVESEGERFICTVVRQGTSGGTTRARVVGGGGGLSRTVDAQNFTNGPTLRTIVNTLLGDSEKLSDTSDSSLLGSELPAYHLTEDRASHSLTRLLDHFDAIWRVLADGTVWIGRDEYPEADIEHVVIDEDWHSGSIFIAPEKPELRPGVTFLGHKLEEVVHWISSSKLRTEAKVTSAGSALGKFLGQIRRSMDYAKRWPAKVAKVNSDGTVQIVPDEPRIRGNGLDNVRVRSGVPGSVKPKKGARCLLGFDNGDPAQPYVADWDDGEVDEIVLADGTADAARIGSTVRVYFPPMMPIQGTINGTTPFAGVLTVPRPGAGTVVGNGNPKVKV